MKQGKQRVQLSLDKDVVARLQAVKRKYGITMSAQIETLIRNYSEEEYGVAESVSSSN